jgi:hypothetical protein
MAPRVSWTFPPPGCACKQGYTTHNSTYRMIVCRMSPTLIITLYVKRNEAQPGGGPYKA